MQQVAEGDLDRFKHLFDRHHGHVYHFLYKMCGDAMLSEDLTQEVFYKLIKYRATYAQGSFKAWMFTVARNSLKTHFRREPFQKVGLEILEYREVDQENNSGEEQAQLWHALAKLDPADRELIVLSRIKEIRHGELAQILDSTPGAIKTRLSRALKKLRNLYFENP